MDVREISLLGDNGKLFKVTAYIADSPGKRAAGYQFVCAETVMESSILFVFPGNRRGKFHMNNVESDLDIGFFDKSGLLISTDLMKKVAEGQSRLYGPDRAYKYALEAYPGFFKKHGMSAEKARFVVYSLR